MKTCRKDFQGRKNTTVLKLLCRNIAAGRFNWRRYCTPQTYFGQEICVTPLHCSYGQIGYTVHFPYSNMPEVEYDWEMGKLTVDEENWKEYFRHREQWQGAGIHTSPKSFLFIVMFLSLIVLSWTLINCLSKSLTAASLGLKLIYLQTGGNHSGE